MTSKASNGPDPIRPPRKTQLPITGNEIGARIQEARIAKGLKQKELSERLLVTYAAVSQWERGFAVPPKHRLLKLAEILGVSVEWLQDGRGDGAPLLQAIAAEVNRVAREYPWAALHLIEINGKDHRPAVADFGPETILADRPATRQLFAARIIGDDNTPLFSYGDLIIADTGIRVRPGDFVLAKIASEDHAILRQLKNLRRRDDGYLSGELHALNADYAVETIVLDKEESPIIGVIVEHRRLRRF